MTGISFKIKGLDMNMTEEIIQLRLEMETVKNIFDNRLKITEKEYKEAYEQALENFKKKYPKAIKKEEEVKEK